MFYVKQNLSKTIWLNNRTINQIAGYHPRVFILGFHVFPQTYKECSKLSDTNVYVSSNSYGEEQMNDHIYGWKFDVSSIHINIECVFRQSKFQNLILL